MINIRLGIIILVVVLAHFSCSNNNDPDILLSSSANNVVSSSSSNLSSDSSSSSFSDGTSSSSNGIVKTRFTDIRDGKEYKSVIIGTQTWMSENLNYAGDDNVGRCYGDNDSNCVKYGRMYAMSEVACPYGWHLPSNDEWNVLLDFVSANAGTKLKATSPDWNGTDDYGFAALPGGYCGDACPDNNSPFTALGTSSFWWTASVGSPVPLSITRSISESNNVGIFQSYSNSRFYARCVHGLPSNSNSSQQQSSSSEPSSSSQQQSSIGDYSGM
jgi:uncharacterized protein (TIGR02145 family)